MKFRITKPFIIGFSFVFVALIAVAASKEIRDSIVKIAKDQLGQFYEMDEYTGGWPPGFDCSGLVSYAYLKSGIKGFEDTTPNSHGPNTTALVNMSELISGEPYPGDLVFRHSTYDKNKDGVVDNKDTYTHVGIYIGNDTIIHAGNPVQTAKLSEWKNDENKKIKFAGMRRIKAIYWPNKDDTYITEGNNEKLVTYKNPFQDFYDFYPKDGELQKCMRNTLGDKFTLFYNGDSIPTEEDLNPAQHCFDHRDIKQYINSLPPSVLQCFKNALGSDFEKALADQSFKESPEAERQIEACPAFQEYTAKADTLQKYIIPKRQSSASVPPQQSQSSPLDTQVPFSAIENRLRPNSSDYGYHYVLVGVWNCGNCIGPTKGIFQDRESAEKLARELSSNFLGIFEQHTIDFDADYRPEAIEAMLLLAQEKGVIPRASIKKGYYDGNGKFWSSDLWNKPTTPSETESNYIVNPQIFYTPTIYNSKLTKLEFTANGFSSYGRAQMVITRPDKTQYKDYMPVGGDGKFGASFYPNTPSIFPVSGVYTIYWIDVSTEQQSNTLEIDI